MLLDRAPHDYDIATGARPEAVRALFPHHFEVGAAFGVITVIAPQGMFEVATFRRDADYNDGRHPERVTFVDAQEDARRRDFTINALFLDPETDCILDYVGGREDLRAEVVRAVGDAGERFEEDHLRILRAARFAARLNFAIAPETKAAMAVAAPKLQRISAERIREELLKMLTEGGAERAFRIMAQTGVLHEVLPEVAAMDGVEQPAAFHPEGDVLEHTMQALRHLDAPTPTLAMGVLLHDVGKPNTQEFADRIRFNFHDKVGARMAETICQRLRFSKVDTERIAWLVGQHMRFVHIPDMRESKRRRFFREDGFDELAALCRVDALASHGMPDGVDKIQASAHALTPEEITPEPLLRGRDLIALGYTPGPAFATMLSAVEDAQLEGQLTTSEEARAFIQARWPME